MMSPHIYRQLAQERHRDLLLEADSSRLAREAIDSRPVRPAGSTHPDRRAVSDPRPAMWPQPRGDALELQGRPLSRGTAPEQPDLVDATAAER
jgi:hypothetical protein